MPLRSRSYIEYDELTDLPTMMYFRRYAITYVRNAHKYGRKAYLVYFNLENFSTFNERYGFEEGDRLLRLMALAIEEQFPGFLLSRFSGDHFLLVCESYDLETGITEARKQVHAFGRNANVELKAGIYTIEDEDMDIGLACDRAKIACDSIAHHYDCIYRWFDDALNWRVERGKYIESHIDRAMKEGWIKVYYQPIVRSISGEVCEFEALVRWEDPQYGLLSPAVFIDVLESAHLIHKLDAYVIRQVCSEWSRLRGDGKWRIPTSVNLSRLDFELCDVFEMVEGAVREFGVPRQILHIEVTESALNQNTELLASNVERFRKAGYQVWLDDFGSGYSSLNTLKDFVFDVVKIDMAFLRDFDSKPKSRVIIASVVNMAKQLGMQTLIEGVETPAQYEFVREVGCELVQGYLIGKPVPSVINVQRILAGELVVEPAELRGYCDRLGSVNNLSATPFDFYWDNPNEGPVLSDMLPLATVEVDAGKVRFLRANSAFERVLLDVGLGDLAHVAKMVSDEQSGQAGLVLNAAQASRISDRTESVDLLQNGRHCVFRVRHISSYGSVDAYLVSLMNLSHNADLDDERRVKIAMRYLYAVYDEVYMADLSTGTIGAIYRGNPVYPAVPAGTTTSEAVDRFREVFVHPNDRERYRNFMNMTTVSERVGASERSYLTDAFRALGQNGLYTWLTQVLIPIVYDGANTVLICIRKSNEQVVATITGEDEIPKSLLWDTLLELVPAGVFWKDADRRFVGVNKNFLDFYSFTSVNDVLGKNDEEMGWHVAADPFKNNEFRVLAGESVLNAHGTCISQGEVRHLSASKIPLRRNGEVVGILGYFVDTTGDKVTTPSPIHNGFSRVAEIDELIGIPNLRGFTSSAVSYQESYEVNGLDFVCVVADINGMQDLNDVYGRSFGNLVLKTVGRSLSTAFGVGGVVARIGGDKFAALRQIDQATTVSDTMALVSNAVANVREVAGVRLNLRCYMGYALYSERESMGDILILADERMKAEQTE